MNIDLIWSRIKAYSGEVFYTKTGKPYTYHVNNRMVVLENTNRNIPMSDFEKALAAVNPSISELKKLNVQGSSYIYGIITDLRITK